MNEVSYFAIMQNSFINKMFTLCVGLWRLRINFFVIIVLGFLGGIGYTSILSSFHQFITNPTYEDLEGTRYHHLVGFVQ